MRCDEATFAAAFGAPFDRVDLRDPLPLPGGRMNLVHRVTSLDPTGGGSGLGLIRAEADIHPGDWFMVCHFVDDRVMPGTLMYECCLHTLRIFMMRMGWIGARGRVAFEPVPGVANRLKCRGQVVESTRVVAYEVTIKERGYRPEPYAIADALILADGKPIVEVTDMALQLSGTSRHELERLWAGCDARSSVAGMAAGAIRRARRSRDLRPRPDSRVRDRQAVGRVRRAATERFDDGRFIARLPGPPYQFLDRITRVDGDTLGDGAGRRRPSAEFDIVPDAWYFAADRQDRMPFAVLLEVALQPCGWMAAYMGSALTSEDDLKFRNLGGTAASIGPSRGTPARSRPGCVSPRSRVRPA